MEVFSKLFRLSLIKNMLYESRKMHRLQNFALIRLLKIYHVSFITIY